MIRGTVARWNKDAGRAQEGTNRVPARYDTEMQAKRPEYGEHERAVSDFRAAALGQAPPPRLRVVNRPAIARIWYICALM